MKAVVLEKSGSRYTVLGKNGTFRQVHRRVSAEVGEEIEIRSGIEGFRGLRVWAGVAALFLVVLTTIMGWNLYQAPTAVALLSVDINPSLQFAIDAQGHLVKLQMQNEDAKRMLSKIDLTGKPIAEVLGQIVTQAYDQKFLNAEHHWVVVGYSPMTDKMSKQMPEGLNVNQITTWITENVEKKGFTPQVAVFPLTSQERVLAQKGDLTLGEYALWQTAQKAGVMTQPEKLKDTAERVRLLENPQVQAQIQSVKKGPDSVLPQTTEPAKHDSGSIDKPNKEGTGKPASDGLPPSPVKVPNNPAIEKGKTQYNDKQKEKDLGHADTKAPDKAKNSANSKTERVKGHDSGVYVPVLAPIPTPQNSEHDAYHTYRIPERIDQGEQSDNINREHNENSH